MTVLVVIIALVLLTAVIAVLASPLLRGHSSEVPEDSELQELEAEREAKYREIRDAELDYRMGKLSREDHEAIDAELRKEALAILDRLERHGTGGATPRDA